MRRLAIVSRTALFLLSSATLTASRSAAQMPAAAASERARELVAAIAPLPTAKCTVSGSSDSSLRKTMPEEVLDHLAASHRSPFVHAFLLAFVADTNAGHHRVSECARAFLLARPTQVRELLSSYVDADAIIAALREAERQRKALSAIADSAQLAATLLTRLTRDTSSGNLATVWQQVRTLCGQNTNVPNACVRLDTVIRVVDSLHLARARLDSAEEHARIADKEAQHAAQELSALATSDTAVSVAHPDGAASAAAVAADARTRLDSARAHARSASATATEAAQGAQAAADALKRAYGRTNAVLTNLDTMLVRIPRLSNELRLVAQSAGSPHLTAVVVPDSLRSDPATRVPSSSVTLALTDFIVARAQREIVNSFVLNLHKQVAKEPLLMAAFPESWSLMHGLAVHDDGVLDAVDVGRIPLTTWRATLATDFRALPERLVSAGVDTTCAGTSKEAMERLLGCGRRLATLQPLGAFTRKLLEGEPLLEALGSAATVGPWNDAYPREAKAIRQGLVIVGAIADAYAVQGREVGHDLQHHPYLISVDALRELAPQQRGALLRVLVLRASRLEEDLPLASADTNALYGAITAIARAVEVVATTQADSTRRRGAELSQIVHASFEAIDGSVTIAQHWGTHPLLLDTTLVRWRAFGGTTEALVAGDYGLALSRSIVLLRAIRGTDIPHSVLTLTTLASALAEARDGEQTRMAFETAAAPAGGWQAKRYGAGGATITTYPGIVLGREKVIARSQDPGGTGDAVWSGGPFLPVGIEWTANSESDDLSSHRACHLKIACGWGLYVPIVDLGALMSYRLGGSDSVQTEPNSSMRQVFAPGAYFVVPLTHTMPLTFMFGAQLLPALRTVEVRANDPTATATRSAWRLGAGLGLDLMLLHF